MAGSADAIAQALSAAYASDIEQMGRRARAYVENAFSWDTVMHSHGEIYDLPLANARFGDGRLHRLLERRLGHPRGARGDARASG